MEKEKLYIGAHVSLVPPLYFEGSVKDAIEMGANTFMFYTGAPQNTLRKPTKELRIEEGIKLAKENNIDLNKVIVHAPYVINGANTVKEGMNEFAIKIIKEELKRTSDFKVKTMVLHPGAHVGAGVEKASEKLIEVLNKVLNNDDSEVKIAIETMAGKGSEIGATLENINKIVTSIDKKDRVGVCLDTCHLSDAGYNIKDVDNFLKMVDDIIGINKILCVHINDSKNESGARKDRHENIGYGHIGFDTLYKIVHHPLLDGIPKILETPYVNSTSPYKKEIEMLKSGVYEEGWKDKL